jgi:hypothetical protein
MSSYPRSGHLHSGSSDEDRSRVQLSNIEVGWVEFRLITLATFPLKPLREMTLETK